MNEKNMDFKRFWFLMNLFQMQSEIPVGNKSTFAFGIPKSNILIFESGTPLQYRDFIQGFPFCWR